MEGKTQVVAATLAGVSERSVRRCEKGELAVPGKKERDYRTRPDPFEDVWESVVCKLLLRDTGRVLTAGAVLAHLRGLKPEYKERFNDSLLRTLQRRIRKWRALHGPQRDVVFEQEHPPGREGAFDFTVCDELGVTIGGAAFPHLLFTFTLSHSNWMSVSLAFSETFEAVVSGLQDALWGLGGVPEVLRHDNMSAATRELKKGGGRSLTKRFQDVVDHYGVRSTRIRPGHSQENGGAEKTNHVTKSNLKQALVLRGSLDFQSPASYMKFVQSEVVDARNNRHATRIKQELPHLLPLPTNRLPEFTEFRPTVRRMSIIRVAGRTYSVPSRLIGHKLVVHQYADHLEVFYDGTLTEMMERLRGDASAQIDYRHLVGSLVRKPGAFERYKHREAFFPTLIFRQTYDRLSAWHGHRADAEYLLILRVAAETMESRVNDTLELLLLDGKRFDSVTVKALAAPEPPRSPEVNVGDVDLSQYDRLTEFTHDYTDNVGPAGAHSHNNTEELEAPNSGG